MENTNFNIAPYFDDYDPSKNFHKILFKPRTVQARELNQLQSILQDQINRFGDHIFHDGSLVQPGGLSVVLEQRGIEYNLDPGYTIEQITSVTEKLYIESPTGTLAELVKVLPDDEFGVYDPCMFIEYLSSGPTGESMFFQPGQTCTIYYNNEDDNRVDVATITIINTTIGIWAKAKAGIYYVRGYFVNTTEEDLVISRNRERLDSAVGYRVHEEIVTELNDRSLYSNAVGEPNFKGPGAARFKFRLELDQIDLNTSDPNFITIMTIVDGAVQTNVSNSNYSLLEMSIARRTYETNGNFTVRPFKIQLKNHLKTSQNDTEGVYLASEGGSEDKFVVQVKPGLGYVGGYRIETVGVFNIDADRARETGETFDVVTSSQYGPYIIVENVAGFPPIDIRQRIRFLDSGDAVVGSAAVRAFRRDSDTQYRLYVFDFKFDSGKSFQDAVKVDSIVAPFSATLVSNVVFDSSKDNLLFKIPYSGISSVRPDANGTISYTVSRTFTATLNSSGVASIALGSSELFGEVNNFEYVVNVGTTMLVPSDVLSLSGSPVGRVLNIDAGITHASAEISISSPVLKLSTVERTKSLNTNTLNVSFANESRKALAHNDVLRIVSINDITDPINPVDVKDLFNLDNGQRPSWYERGAIETVDGRSVTYTNIQVVYEYFEHGPGDYFSVDSYTGVDRDLIPSYAGVSLTDVFDFRQDKDASGSFPLVSNVGDPIKPGSTIRSDVEYYLPRIDSLYLTDAGEFMIEKGVPSMRPVAPNVPAMSMRLYDIFVPQYTADINDVILNFIENKRYTMRDIGKLEKRIENVEYYTTLSMLETKTNTIQIIDPVTGNNRYKNGFAVDGFQDFTLGDVGNPTYQAANNIDEGKLEATFIMNDGQMELISRDNHKTLDDEFYTIASGEKLIISQPTATRTININPYAVFTWVGILKLTPNQDFWKDVVYQQPIQRYFHTVEGTREKSYSTVIASSITFSPVIPTIGIWGVQFATGTETVQTTNFEERNRTVNELTADRMVREDVIYYMRSIDIAFRADNMRPYTRVYPFFDGVAISQHCRPAGAGLFGQPLITDEFGKVEGIFRVPNDQSMRFKTGNSSFRLTDSPTDDRSPDSFSTVAVTTFQSNGVQESRQKEYTETTTTYYEAVSTVSTSTQIVPSIAYIDPIAQTFMVPGQNGNIISKVGVKFATKSRTVPVILEIRPVENGVPAGQVVLGSQTILQPSQVNVSDNASAWTYFEFKRPIYLEPGREYAVVLMAETQDYNVYIAEMGQNIIGQNAALGKQPNLGVFLHSANANTWTPAQNQDLVFEVWASTYDTNTVSTLEFGNVEPLALPTRFNPISSILGSDTYTIYMRSHGLKSGDKFTLSGVLSGNGVLNTDVNGEHTVISNTLDFITFAIPGTSPTVTGSFGGASVRVKANYPITSIFTYVDGLKLPNTNIRFEISYLDQGTRTLTPFTPVDISSDIFLSFEGVITKARDYRVRIIMTTDTNELSPIVYVPSMTSIYKGKRINNDEANTAFCYVTKDIKFDNPSSSARFYTGAKLPSSTTMKLYYKLFVESDEDVGSKPWVELNPVEPLVNNDSTFFEHQYQLEGVGNFVGYKIMIKFLGVDPVRTPELSDFRSIALA